MSLKENAIKLNELLFKSKKWLNDNQIPAQVDKLIELSSITDKTKSLNLRPVFALYGPSQVGKLH